MRTALSSGSLAGTAGGRLGPPLRPGAPGPGARPGLPVRYRPGLAAAPGPLSERATPAPRSAPDHWQALRDRRERDAAEDHELRALTFSTDFADRSRGLQLAERWGYDGSRSTWRRARRSTPRSRPSTRRSCNGGAKAWLRPCWSSTATPIPAGRGSRGARRALPQARLAVLSDVGYIPMGRTPREASGPAARSFLLAIHTDATRSAGGRDEPGGMETRISLSLPLPLGASKVAVDSYAAA